MRYVIIFIVLAPILSNCATIFGGLVGSKIDSKSHETTLKFLQYGQDIIVVKQDGEKVTGTFRGFVYRLDTADQVEPSLMQNETSFKEISFPNIGDSISVQTQHQATISGKFSGISYAKKGFELMVYAGNPATVNYIAFHTIDQLGVQSDFSDILHPEINRVYLQYEVKGNLSEVALSDLTFKRTNATTSLILLGAVVDVAATVAAISVGNQLNDFRSDN